MKSEKDQGPPFLDGPFCFLWRRTSQLVLQRINHGDVGFNFDGLTVENGRTVAPLGDSIDGGSQERSWSPLTTCKDWIVPSVAITACNFHLAFAMNLPSRKCGIDRLNATDQHC